MAFIRCLHDHDIRIDQASVYKKSNFSKTMRCADNNLPWKAVNKVLMPLRDIFQTLERLHS